MGDKIKTPPGFIFQDHSEFRIKNCYEYVHITRAFEPMCMSSFRCGKHDFELLGPMSGGDLYRNQLSDRKCDDFEQKEEITTVKGKYQLSFVEKKP